MTDRGDFVVAPGVVDSALAGQPWGTTSLALTFGSARVVLEGLADGQLAATKERYRDLVTDPPQEATVAVRLVRAERAGFRVIDTRGWVNTMALEHARDHVVVVGRDFVSRVQLSVLTPDGRGPADGLPVAAVVATWLEDEFVIAAVENTLRIVCAYRSLARGGVLLHCAGLVDDGRAYVCFGPSGIGKSTAAMHWLARGRTILSDELCALEREGDHFVVEQLPFAGDVASGTLVSGRAPLAGLHRLAQGPECTVDDVRKKDAVAALLGCAPFVNIDRYRLPTVLASLEAIASAHPVSKLTLTLGADPLLVLAGIRERSRFSLKRDVRYRVIDGEAVVVLQGSSEVLGLNGTGSLAFDLAARGKLFHEIVDALGEELDVERTILAADLRAFFQKLAGDGLIEIGA